MNNTFAFSNAEEFKELFGMRKTQDGTLVRKNKIVLGFLRDYNCHKYIRDIMPDFWRNDLFHIQTPDELYLYVLSAIRTESYGENFIKLPRGLSLYSNDYKLDYMGGLCEDGDVRAIRYINCESGRVFKMKAGRFLKHLILETEFGKHLPESTILYLCEEFSRRWETYAASQMPEFSAYHLVVDDDFESIYDGYKCKGDFGSCMTNRGFHSFYNNAVKAKAASLRNGDGKIVARCVVFTEVQDDETGEVFRLAERQYATDGEEVLKRLLVDSLIREGYIDGFKTVGASCHENRNFVMNDGTSMRDRELSIDCDLDLGDYLSYQDSFIEYDIDRRRAYNYGSCDYELDTTEGSLEGNYDEYHECYTTSDLVSVYVNGQWMDCSVDDLDDFVYVESEGWVHEDDACHCEQCDRYFIDNDGCYSELTGETYCCDYCRDRAEQEYREENWYYAEIDEEYFEDEDDVTEMYVWSNWTNSYASRTISRDLLEEKVSDGEAFEYEGEYYNTLEHLDTSATA